MYTQRSFVLKPAEAKKKWFIVDAKDKVVGRLATEVANVLRGKNNPKFTRHTDSGDFVVVINAEKVKMTGKKWTARVLYTHSGFPGGQREHTPSLIREKHPERLVEHAVRGMLPKNKLAFKMLQRLKVYTGTEHPHQAQLPEAKEIGAK